MTPGFIHEHYLSEDEVAKIMRLRGGVKTLKRRRAQGVEHPPYITVGNEIYYPKPLFLDWMNQRPIVWEVKRAG